MRRTEEPTSPLRSSRDTYTPTSPNISRSAVGSIARPQALEAACPAPHPNRPSPSSPLRPATWGVLITPSTPCRVARFPTEHFRVLTRLPAVVDISPQRVGALGEGQARPRQSAPYGSPSRTSPCPLRQKLGQMADIRERQMGICYAAVVSERKEHHRVGDERSGIRADRPIQEGTPGRQRRVLRTRLRYARFRGARGGVVLREGLGTLLGSRVFALSPFFRNFRNTRRGSPPRLRFVSCSPRYEPWRTSGLTTLLVTIRCFAPAGLTPRAVGFRGFPGWRAPRAAAGLPCSRSA